MTITERCALDDQVLRDIGVYRYEIASMVEMADNDDTRLPLGAFRRVA